MIRIYKTKVFERWLKKSEVTDLDLIQAVKEMNMGLVDADLSEHLFKKRIALPDRGKRSGVRTLVASKIDENTYPLYPKVRCDFFKIAGGAVMSVINYFYTPHVQFFGF